MDKVTLEEAATMVGRPWVHPGTGVTRWYVPAEIAGNIRHISGFEWRMGRDKIAESTAKRHLRSKVYVERGRVFVNNKPLALGSAFANADVNIIAAAVAKQVAA